MGPEELLAQIRSLLDQYLALGGDTPVAPEAQAFAQAIDAATGGGGEETGEPPMPGGQEVPPEPGGMPGMPPPDQSGAGLPPMPPGGPKDFGSASDMALADLKKKKAKAY